MQDNYSTIEQKLRNRENFQGNTMFGYNNGETYVVFSYNTPIAWFYQGGWELDSRRYSVTTSKHQGLIRRTLGLKPLKASERAWA
jgi:hypothetical protein